MPNISGIVKKTDYKAKITEIEGKAPTTALTVVEKKIPNVSNLKKKKKMKNKKIKRYKIIRH